MIMSVRRINKQRLGVDVAFTPIELPIATPVDSFQASLHIAVLDGRASARDQDLGTGGPCLVPPENATRQKRLRILADNAAAAEDRAVVDDYHIRYQSVAECNVDAATIAPNISNNCTVSDRHSAQPEANIKTTDALVCGVPNDDASLDGCSAVPLELHSPCSPV